MKLYKYLPKEYISDLEKKDTLSLLFRPIKYFSMLEHDGNIRQDIHEGDYCISQGPAKLTISSKKTDADNLVLKAENARVFYSSLKNRFAFINCFSRELSHSLFDTFSGNNLDKKEYSCIEICDAEKFIYTVKQILSEQICESEYFILEHGDIHYYEINKEKMNPPPLATWFYKPKRYSYQKEYRLAFSLLKGCEINHSNGQVYQFENFEELGIKLFDAQANGLVRIVSYDEIMASKDN